MTNTGLEHCSSFITSQVVPGGTPTRVPDADTCRAVTISRQAGCGAVVVAEKLAQYLQKRLPGGRPWTVFDRNLMDKVLEDHHLPLGLAKYLPEDRVSEFQDFLIELSALYPPARTVVRQTVETMRRLVDLGRVILIGRGGNVIAAGRPRVFHVRLVAPFEHRVAHAREFYDLKEDAAREFCRREDLGRKRYLKKYFNAEVDDPLLYHLTLNTGWVGYEAAAEIIGKAALHLT